MSLDEGDAATLAELNDAKYNGARRYYVYDVSTRGWSIVTFAHSPYFIMQWEAPPEFMAPSEAGQMARRLVFQWLRVALRHVDRKLERW